MKNPREKLPGCFFSVQFFSADGHHRVLSRQFSKETVQGLIRLPSMVSAMKLNAVKIIFQLLRVNAPDLDLAFLRSLMDKPDALGNIGTAHLIMTAAGPVAN